ncbi:hypothetical protein JQ609_15795 [Bradyrhizobium sp. AUGA SZCCT0169]|uniref:hypothetical protein n=1 Tax=Bradyrhizobium sp. AUGA SZCCT0169 TaxID=2807663 RepID=UPI001BACD191|nr:hypothetical protein [Bradyrhizobium sp. AUGA SZCCT0169]MBR1248386.1 hypothetical protein [Bradyrhizobium sp. AUGA SZCCT0169]
MPAGAVRDIELIRQQRVILHAKRQATLRRPNEHAARRSQFDEAGTVASCNARLGRSGSFESISAENQTDQSRCRPRREGKDHAAQFTAKAAAGAKGMTPEKPQFLKSFSRSNC